MKQNEETSLDILKLRKLTQETLMNNNIKTINQLLRIQKSQLLKIKGLGNGKAKEILDKLVEHGFRKSIEYKTHNVTLHVHIDGTRYFLFDGIKYIYSEADKCFKEFK